MTEIHKQIFKGGTFCFLHWEFGTLIGDPIVFLLDLNPWNIYEEIRCQMLILCRVEHFFYATVWGNSCYHLSSIGGTKDPFESSFVVSDYITEL